MGRSTTLDLCWQAIGGRPHTLGLQPRKRALFIWSCVSAAALQLSSVYKQQEGAHAPLGAAALWPCLASMSPMCRPRHLGHGICCLASLLYSGILPRSRLTRSDLRLAKK